MKTVTFARPYRHKTATGHLAYPAGFTGEVSEDVCKAADMAGVLKPEGKKAAARAAKKAAR